MARTVATFQRSGPLVQGSFYLLRRKCGKPSCRCASGQLHESYVLTRSEAGKDRIYPVPKEERPLIRKQTAEYRRYQRARALLVKRQAQLLKLIDQIAEQRLRIWPERKSPP